jgi:hypothetical protein
MFICNADRLILQMLCIGKPICFQGNCWYVYMCHVVLSFSFVVLVRLSEIVLRLVGYSLLIKNQETVYSCANSHDHTPHTHRSRSHTTHPSFTITHHTPIVHDHTPHAHRSRSHITRPSFTITHHTPIVCL